MVYWYFPEKQADIMRFCTVVNNLVKTDDIYHTLLVGWATGKALSWHPAIPNQIWSTGIFQINRLVTKREIDLL